MESLLLRFKISLRNVHKISQYLELNYKSILMIINYVFFKSYFIYS